MRISELMECDICKFHVSHVDSCKIFRLVVWKYALERVDVTAALCRRTQKKLPPISRRESQRIEKVFSPRCGGTDFPCRRFHGFRAAYSPSRRFSIVTIWARVQGACGISRLSAPLRIAAFTAHVIASSA